MVKRSNMKVIKTTPIGGFTFKCPTMGNYPSKQYCLVSENETGMLAVEIVSLVLVPVDEEYKGFITLKVFKDKQLICRHTAMQVRSLAAILGGVKQIIEDRNNTDAATEKNQG